MRTSPPLFKLGVWEDNKFIGVVIYARGASSNLLKPYGLNQNDGCELVRVALNNHKTPVSRILSISIGFLKKNNPKLKLIVSFADPEQGHHGGIYQAANWIYCGQSAKSFKYIDSSGREWHSRQVSEKGYNIQQGLIRKSVKPSECKKILCEGKHRYLFPLTDEMREQVIKLSKPYPKRASSVESGTTSFQDVGGGESPTDALHINKENNGSRSENGRQGHKKGPSPKPTRKAKTSGRRKAIEADI